MAPITSSIFTVKSSPSSSVCSDSSKPQARSARSAPAVGQLCVLGSPAPRCPRRVAPQSAPLRNLTRQRSSTESDELELQLAWPESNDTTREMHELLLAHSPSSVATRLRSAPRRPTPGRHSKALQLKRIPRSAPLQHVKPARSVPESLSSSRSLTASSAGDMSSDVTRPPGPSPPSSVSPTCSIYEESLSEERYSFPVPPFQLRQALNARLQEADDSSPCEDMQPQSDALTLADIQEKVVELVEAQRSCSQITWLTMQRLSATLERLCPVQRQPPAAPPPPPPPLLLEAAACARRLAQILAQLGDTPAVTSAPSLPRDVPPLVTRPSADELLQQRTRLRHVSPLTRNNVTVTGKVEHALREAMVRRRLSFESSSTTGTSTPGASCWAE